MRAKVVTRTLLPTQRWAQAFKKFLSFSIPNRMFTDSQIAADLVRGGALRYNPVWEGRSQQGCGRTLCSL